MKIEDLDRAKKIEEEINDVEGAIKSIRFTSTGKGEIVRFEVRSTEYDTKQISLDNGFKEFVLDYLSKRLVELREELENL